MLDNNTASSAAPSSSDAFASLENGVTNNKRKRRPAGTPGKQYIKHLNCTTTKKIKKIKKKSSLLFVFSQYLFQNFSGSIKFCVYFDDSELNF